MERRKNFCLEHNIKKIEFSTNDNPLAGRVICGNCGGLFDRKVWNSNNEKLRRIIWRCNGKYIEKGVIGCDNRHLDDKVFYDAFVEVFNSLVENREQFIVKWHKLLQSEDLLKKVTAKRFISVFENAVPISCFDVDLYFMLVEKITVCEGSRLAVGLLDGSKLEVGIR